MAGNNAMFLEEDRVSFFFFLLATSMAFGIFWARDQACASAVSPVVAKITPDT